LAKGVCEDCGQNAPFEVDGLPFLEVHHVKHLTQKGSDSVGNINASSIPLACLIDISQIDAALTKT
jgi:hypothetical protein